MWTRVVILMIRELPLRRVSKSNIEEEYQSLVDTSSNVTWVKSILDDKGIKLVEVLCNKLSTVSMTIKSMFHARTKHIDLDLHIVREEVLNHQLQVNHVSATAQTANVLTKSLSLAFFTVLKEKLRVVPVDG
ncbi:hypothetical protein J1N35_034017 [Gossypium stocksii]|uniref:RNase H type-1 domain-containing protein n=1 Tax=Gossypium stocksii TaxID=47602 RepID=A0A9D3UR98_9ROSI|nr:hypothetical protein J1N35_034017 [Gossypium stocksii]